MSTLTFFLQIAAVCITEIETVNGLPVNDASHPVERVVERHKRSTPVIDFAIYAARKAVQKLLSGATQTGDGNIVRTYIKTGSDKQYLKDFEALRPTNTHERIWGNGVVDHTGYLGDITIFTTNRGPNGIPVLEIQSPVNGGRTKIVTVDRITYIPD